MYLDQEIFDEILFGLEITSREATFNFDYNLDGLEFRGYLKFHDDFPPEIKIKIDIFGDLYQLRKIQEDALIRKLHQWIREKERDEDMGY